MRLVYDEESSFSRTPNVVRYALIQRYKGRKYMEVGSLAKQLLEKEAKSAAAILMMARKRIRAVIARTERRRLKAQKRASDRHDTR